MMDHPAMSINEKMQVSFCFSFFNSIFVGGSFYMRVSFCKASFSLSSLPPGFGAKAIDFKKLAEDIDLFWIK
ncbi:hypothetical protein FRX31_013662, partial [Thalictrum thalictroides]